MRATEKTKSDLFRAMAAPSFLLNPFIQQLFEKKHGEFKPRKKWIIFFRLINRSNPEARPVNLGRDGTLKRQEFS